MTTAAAPTTIEEPPFIDRNERRFQTWQEAEQWWGQELPEKVRVLYRQPRFDQRTPPWFDERDLAITGSVFAASIGQGFGGATSDIEFFREKVGLKPPFTGNQFTRHGVKYEDAAIWKYEAETGNRILDFGLLSHTDLFQTPVANRPNLDPMEHHNIMHGNERPEEVSEGRWEQLKDLRWLKGSPDGITIDRETGELIVVEAKCPNRDINPQTIADYYYPQVIMMAALIKAPTIHFVQYKPPWMARPGKCAYDCYVLKFDPNWFQRQKEVARRTWQWVLSYRETGQIPQEVQDRIDKKNSRKHSLTCSDGSVLVLITNDEPLEKKQRRLTDLDFVTSSKSNAPSPPPPPPSQLCEKCQQPLYDRDLCPACLDFCA